MTSQPARSALVCGSDDRLAQAIATRLVADGLVVAILATASANTSYLEARTGLPVFNWDIGDFQACEAGMRRVSAHFGILDILVNSAAVSCKCPLRALTQPMWREVIKVNLGGCFNLAKAALPSMLEQKFGRIVSIASAEEMTDSIANRAAAVGLQGLIRALALEGQFAGVTANLIALGCRTDDEAIPDWPQDVAHAVAFLCSDASAHITGSMLTIGGGAAAVQA